MRLLSLTVINVAHPFRSGNSYFFGDFDIILNHGFCYRSVNKDKGEFPNLHNIQIENDGIDTSIYYIHQTDFIDHLNKF